MAFHNVRLPVDVERGAQGGPRFKTTVMILGGGHEKRNIDWETTKGEWDIGYGIESKEDMQDVIDFFYCRWGKAHGFRFKDWTDYQVGLLGSPVTFNTGDGSTAVFQARKRYSSGGINFDRDLKKLVAGTIEVYVNGVLQTLTTHYTIDIETGLITFVTPPTNGHSIALVCEFDVPVRFDTDALNITAETFNTGSIPQIPVVELKDE